MNAEEAKNKAQEVRSKIDAKRKENTASAADIIMPLVFKEVEYMCANGEFSLSFSPRDLHKTLDNSIEFSTVNEVARRLSNLGYVVETSGYSVSVRWR